MKQLAIIIHLLLLCGLATVNMACAKQTEAEIRAEASYTRLCKIYEDVINLSLNSYESTHTLYKRFRILVPELHVVTDNISNAARENVYDLYKQAAEYAIGSTWDCPAIKSYYQIKWEH